MSERESKRPSLPARKECAEFKDAVEKFGKRGPAETWPNCIESEYSSSKPPQSGYRGRHRLLCQFRHPPKSFSACRVHDPANSGSMPKMEFFNSIQEKRINQKSLRYKRIRLY